MCRLILWLHIFCLTLIIHTSSYRGTTIGPREKCSNNMMGSFQGCVILAILFALVASQPMPPLILEYRATAVNIPEGISYDCHVVLDVFIGASWKNCSA